MTRVYLAIGETCDWWSIIEHFVHDICLHLASCQSADFNKSINRVPLHIALSNMDLRDRISTAKAFASQVRNAKPGFYKRLESTLNRIDNELRIERNRYVHDLWMLSEDGKAIERFQKRTVVTRPQSHKLELEIGTMKPFSSVDEVEMFVIKLEEAYHDLVQLDEETASMSLELERLEAVRQAAELAS